MTIDSNPVFPIGNSAVMKGTVGGATPGTSLLFNIGDATTVQTVRTGADQWRVDRAFQLVALISFSLVTAPTGAAFNLDVMKNGVTIYTTKPRIDISGTSSLAAAVQSVYDTAQIQFAVGDIFRIDVLQIGSTVAGAGLRYTVPLLFNG
jgi:hypothetical protein